MAEHSEENQFDQSDGGLAIEEGRPQLKEPPRYAVLLHNDDYTTMEFVVLTLKRYFHKTEDEAAQIMMRVHQQGKAAAGIYSEEIAETKIAQVHQYARGK